MVDNRNMDSADINDISTIEQEEYDYGSMQEIVDNYDIINGRSDFYANGYNFKIKPLRLCDGEEFSKITKAIIFFESILKDESLEESNRKRSLFINMTMSFQHNSDLDVNKMMSVICPDENVKINLWGKYILKNYNYYNNNALWFNIAKWIEKTVEHNGKKVTLYNLENRYQLTKIEIVNLLVAITKLGGFM